MQGRTLAVDVSKFHSPLYADFVSGKLEGTDEAHASFAKPDSWGRLAELAVSTSRATPEFWAETEAYNARLGAAQPAIENIRALAGGRGTVVVGGQQPGLLGGPALVLYKAATAVALAESVTEVTGAPCAPIFIVSADDSDFAEISRCTVYDRSLRRLSVAFSAEGYRPGLVVGALPAVEERDLAGSLLDAVGASPGAEFVADLIEGCAAAADHGEFVSAMLSRLFSSEGLIVLDGRSVEMRRAGRGLFQAYLSHWGELAVAVRATGKELERRGYHAQLSGPGLDRWLFIVEDGVRVKAGLDEAGRLLRADADSPQSLTPNVALRPLWRDSTLPVVFSVLGPSEVAYTLQLDEAYGMLNVPRRGLFPRLAATLVPPEGEEVAGAWTESALSHLLNDYAGALRSHYLRLLPSDAAAAIARARKTAGEGMRALEQSLGALSNEWGKAVRSLAQAGERGLSKLESDIMDSLKRDAQSAHPRLKGLGEFLLPDGKAQERTLSLLVPFLEGGGSFLRDLLDMAREHVRLCSTGRVRHYCRKLDREG